MKAKHTLNYDAATRLYEIFQHKTEQLINATYKEDKASALHKKLENGTGFDGNTPKYFAQKGLPRECEEYK